MGTPLWASRSPAPLPERTVDHGQIGPDTW